MSEGKATLDEEGFVTQTDLWSESLAETMAKQQFNITLTDTHKKVISYVRDYYLKWGAIPMNRTIVDRVKVTNQELDDMFKRGTSSSRGVICKLGGLPKMMCVAMGC